MTRRWISLVIVSSAMVVAGSAGIAAQDLVPCKPLAPGARCGASLSGNVWQLDFGAPKPAPAPPQEPNVSHWQHSPATRLMTVKALQVPALLDPVDCKMVKPVDPTLDPKSVFTHSGHAILSGRVATVAPCKTK